MTPLEAHELIERICTQALGAGAYKTFDIALKVNQALALLKDGATALQGATNPQTDGQSVRSE